MAAASRFSSREQDASARRIPWIRITSSPKDGEAKRTLPGAISSLQALGNARPRGRFQNSWNDSDRTRIEFPRPGIDSHSHLRESKTPNKVTGGDSFAC